MELLGLSKLNEILLSGKVEFKIEIDKMEVKKTTVSMNGVELAGISRLVLDVDEGLVLDLVVKEDNTYGKHKLQFKPYFAIPKEVSESVAQEKEIENENEPEIKTKITSD